MNTEKEEISFSDYSDNAKKLVKELFGETLYKKLNSTKLKSFNWEGLDISTSSILAVCPGIKQRFEEMSISNSIERGDTPLDLLISSLFHYGYQQAVDNEIPRKNEIIESQRLTIDALQGVLNKLKKD